MNRLASLLLAAALAATPALARAEDKPAGVTFTPYGFLMFNSFWSAGVFANKDNANRAQGIGATDSNGSFVMVARGSRFGVKLDGLDTGILGASLQGVYEADFKGGINGTTSAVWNQAVLRSRLLYANASWKTHYGTWSVLVGQDYGLLLNVNPNSVTYGPDPVFVQAGNLYRRTQQLRLTYGVKAGGFDLTAQGAVLSPADADGTAVDYGAGNRSRVPDLEGRVAASGKLSDSVNGTLGIGYHSGWRRYTDANGHWDKRATLLGVDGDVNLTQYAQLKGEWFQSKGADDGYNGMASPSAVTTTAPATTTLTRSTGWWLQLTLKPMPQVWFAFGKGIEKADKDTVATTGANSRYQNEQIHAAVIVNAGKNLKLGFDVAQVTSTYRDTTAGSVTSGAPKATQFGFTTVVPF